MNTAESRETERFSRLKDHYIALLYRMCSVDYANYKYITQLHEEYVQLAQSIYDSRYQPMNAMLTLHFLVGICLFLEGNKFDRFIDTICDLVEDLRENPKSVKSSRPVVHCKLICNLYCSRSNPVGRQFIEEFVDTWIRMYKASGEALITRSEINLIRANAQRFHANCTTPKERAAQRVPRLVTIINTLQTQKVKQGLTEAKERKIGKAHITFL